MKKNVSSCFPAIRGKLKKIFLTMKLTTIMTLIFTCSVYASVYSQSTKINQEMKGWTIREVFQQIERESRYRFFYNDDLKEIDRKVDFSTKDSNVEEILEQLFSGF